MSIKKIRRFTALATVSVLLTACSFHEKSPNETTDSNALIWSTWSGYDNFLELATETYPDIELDFTYYAGGNSTGHRWAQMRGDDIPDVFGASQILDEDLAKERLLDLSGYDFVDNLSTAVLDQVAIDGNIYYLPVNNVMYGIFYNKTLMEEHNWQVPTNFAELEALCAEIEKEGLIPGVLATDLTGHCFSAVFNLAKTSWLTTLEGVNWEQDFLSGNATAAGMWENTMDYVQKYVDIGMFHTDPEDRNSADLLTDYLGNRKAVFLTATMAAAFDELPDTGDQLGMMPYISEDGSKNVYMCNTSTYIGISKKLTEPGNEKKLEDAVNLLTLLYSPEGQSTIITEDTPGMLSALDGAQVSKDAMIYDAQQALRDGRAFPMTYAHWENVLAEMGQAYKEWFRGENDMDGARCIARMDELQSNYLNNQEEIYFCESTADFTTEETACLVGKALGSSVGADAAIIPYTEKYKENVSLQAGISGKLYQDRINVDVASTITPGFDGEYAVMTMTGAEAKELADNGFDAAGDGDPYPYVLVAKGGELNDTSTYQVAFLMNSYTEETGQNYRTQVEKGSIRTFLRDWMTQQKIVSPDGNPWE